MGLEAHLELHMLLYDTVDQFLRNVVRFDRALDEDVPLRRLGDHGLGDGNFRAALQLESSDHFSAFPDDQSDAFVGNRDAERVRTGWTVRREQVVLH